MKEQPSVRVSEPVTDNRPEPPKMPDLWVVRCFVWDTYNKGGWLPMTFSSEVSEERANASAQHRIKECCRRVQVVKIAGDAE